MAIEEKEDKDKDKEREREREREREKTLTTLFNTLRGIGGESENEGSPNSRIGEEESGLEERKRGDSAGEEDKG